MNRTHKFLGYFLLVILLGCHPGDEQTPSVMAESQSISDENQDQINTEERKLIKEGLVEFESNNLSSTRDLIMNSVEKYKGYVSSDEEYSSSGRITNILEIRVASDNFENLLDEITQGVSKFDRKEINAKDVTEEYLDISARLKTKKELEKRYLSLLNRANNITEILEIEKQANELRSEIESIEGRLNYLKNRISLSTLRVITYEQGNKSKGYGAKFKNGLIEGWGNFVLFFVMLANIWPFIIISIGLLISYRLYKKRK